MTFWSFRGADNAPLKTSLADEVASVFPLELVGARAKHDQLGDVAIVDATRSELQKVEHALPVCRFSPRPAP